MKYEVVNVVSTADLGQNVDLKSLNNQSWGLYDLDIYPAGYVKDGDIQGRVTVFHTGKLISVGAKSVPVSFYNLVHAKNLLISAGMTTEVSLKPLVRNMVAVLKFGRGLDISSLVRRVPNIIYEPDQFPGAMIKSRGESTTFLLFGTGKVVVAGVKSVVELEGAIRKLEKLIRAQRISG